jgi:disulfide bond formation protein DsbB
VLIVDRLDRRAWNLLGFAACALMVAYAIFIQHADGLEPCPLCILQRLAMIGVGAVFLAAGLHHPGRTGARLYAVLLGGLALAGSAVAAWHVRLQHLPADEVPACGPGLGYMLDAFPLGDALRMVFTGSGECAEVDWQWLGLSMPAWVLIALLALGALGVLVNWRVAGVVSRKYAQ